MEKFQTFRSRKILILNVTLFTLTLFVFVACQKDFKEPTVQLKTTSINDIQSAKTWFDNYQKSSAVDVSSKFKNGQPDWDNATTVGNVVEVPFRMVDGHFNVPSLYDDQTHFGKERLVIYDIGDKGKVAYMLDYMPSETYSTKMDEVNALNFKKKKFDGIIAAYSLNNENLGGFVWDKGKLIRKYTIKSVDIGLRGCTITTYQFGCGSVSGGPLQCSTGFNVTCWPEYNSYDPTLYNQTVEPASGYDGTWTLEEFCSFAPWSILCTSGGGGNNSDVIDTISVNLTNPCFINIVNNLISGGLETDINLFLRTFNTPDYSLTFVNNVTLPLNVDGNTDRPNSYTIEIALNQLALAHSSSEYISATVLHEILHAYLGVDLGLYSRDETQHNAMANGYINTMTNILKRLYPTLNEEDAWALAWGGLGLTDAWQNLLTAQQRATIIQTNTNHKNLNNANSGSYGTPCN